MKISTITNLIAIVFSLGSVPATAQVSWWQAELNANDAVGSNHGFFYGQSFTNSGTLPGLGYAFAFNGSTSHVRVPDSPSLDFTTALSIEAWIYPFSAVTGYPSIVSKWDAIGVNHRSYILHLDSSGRVYFRVTPNGSEPGFGLGTAISTTQVPLNEWTHVEGVYDGSSVSVYIDGQLEDSEAYNQGIHSGINDLSIGGLVGGIPAPQVSALFHGHIDEVKIDGCGQSCSTIDVTIDIKPHSNPNSINLCSNGAVPVAVLGSESFDVYEINADTLRFAEATVKIVGKKDPHTLCSFEDVNDDLIDDLVCHYLTTNIAALDGESTTATVNGDLFNGIPFIGVDSVNIVMDSCAG